MLEVASPKTWREDVETKPGVYAGLGVREYFLFDPRSEYLTPRLQGYRLVSGAYERLSAVESIDRTLALRSEVLGLELRAKVEGEMRFHDPATGEDLLSHGEEAAARLAEAAARRVAEVQAGEEAAARRAAEDQAGKEAAARREEAAARRMAEARAARETSARRAAEARIAELESRFGAIDD